MSTRLRPLGRPVALALGAALSTAALAGSPAPASAGYYTVYKCYGDVSRDAGDGELIPDLGDGFSLSNNCNPGDEGFNLSVDSPGNGGVSGQNASGSWSITAPNGTEISAVQFDSNLQDANNFRSQVFVSKPSSESYLRTGTGGGDFGYATTYVGGLSHRSFISRVICESSCTGAGATAHAYVRNIAIGLTDSNPPGFSAINGGLTNTAWLRGRQSLSASGGDVGSGVVLLQGAVNGRVVAKAGVTCNAIPPAATQMKPCGDSAGFNAILDTTKAPFKNGSNTVRLSVQDFSGNVVTKTLRPRIDNLDPSVAFANAQNPENPELIAAKAGDALSGLRAANMQYRPVGTDEWTSLETDLDRKSGIAAARIDSLAVPAGEYEFRIGVSDLAGNTRVSYKRADGSPMRLSLPLKGSVDLGAHLNRGGSKAQVVSYGTRAKIKGRLLDAGGTPIVGADVIVVEHFGRGALVRERVTHATTDEKGKYRTKVPKGPSREVEALYGGSAKYAPAQRAAGTFLVRSGATFKTSRKRVPEGKAVRFHGKIRHGGARIPSGGKLLELQVRVKTGRWQTVGEAFRTAEDGTYKRRYRFGKQYSSDALFRFRVKVRRESKWPYKRTNTHQQRVVVEAR